MEIKKPGFFKRSKIILEDNKRFTNKYILTELTKLFEDLYEVKQSRILNVDIDIKKSIFSAIGINIRRKKGNLTLNFIGFIPSLWVRLSLLFTFPILIILVNLNDFNFLQLLDKIILAEFVPFIIVSLILKYRVWDKFEKEIVSKIKDSGILENEKYIDFNSDNIPDNFA